MGSNVSIPVVAITYEQYVQIKVLVSSSAAANLSAFTREPNSRCTPDDDFDDDDPFHWHHGFDKSMLPVLLVGGLLVLTLGGALAALHYYAYVRRRRALLAAQGHLDAGLQWQHNVSLDAVNELPSKVYIPLEEGETMGAGGAGAIIRAAGEPNSNDDGTDTLQINIVDDNPNSSVQSNPGEHEEATCSICLDDFQVTYNNVKYSCQH